MSARELKDLLHKQIEIIEDPEDVQDLFLTVNDFLGHRQLWDNESPEFLDQLRHALDSLHAGSATIPNAQIMREAKEWITR